MLIGLSVNKVPYSIVRMAVRQPERVNVPYAVTVLSDCVTSYDKKKIPEMLAYYEAKGCILKTCKDIIG